jgi:CheY-like chemotaxis protein
MDLAMPGIDGWETLRRISRMGCLGVRLAIVSANAFDKGLDNDVGIRPEDFILKPVRHSELLDWLERRLGLTWLDRLVQTPELARSERTPSTLPDPSELAALLEVVNLGFYRGIMNKLAEIETRQPATRDFVEQMRVLARQFQFETMSQRLSPPEARHAQDA